MPSKLFDEFSAWFPPELEKLKYIWVTNGGSVANLVVADIAFVTNSTSDAGVVHPPTLKILRPDWIQDSISHERRLSLGRYKTVFKALEDFDSDPYVGELLEGTEAYESTRVLSLTPKSAPANQPEAEIQDLSVTDDSAAVSQSRSKEDGSIYRDHRTAQKRYHETQGGSSITNADRRRWNYVQKPQQDEQGRVIDNRSVSIVSDASESLKTIGFPETMDASHPIDLSDSSSPETTRPKKRRLPATIAKDRSTPVTKDTSLDNSFFQSDIELESEAVHSGAGDRPIDQVHDQAKTGIAQQPQQTQQLQQSQPQQAQQLQSEQKKERRMDANDYLIETLLKLTKEKTDLFDASDECVRIYHISTDDIKLQRRPKGKSDEYVDL
ncbi:hypothetical protein BGZ59_003708 [Podila verticillata]|nr:hypothetical protein BGZ59_003708 [Podila verticillata]KFH70205.1 hypothetical protein MVEG_05007 [Podila verticillata NRRL 6337]